jgi:transposase
MQQMICSTSSTCRMHSDELRKKVQLARRRGCTWNDLARKFDLPRSTCRDLVHQEGLPIKLQRGNHVKVKGEVLKRLRVAVKRLFKDEQRITAPKVLARAKTTLSTRTVQRFLHREGLKYLPQKKKIPLTDEHKVKRHQLCETWLVEGQASRNVIFTDESRFSLDGPDHIKSWQRKAGRKVRPRRQQGGGGVLLWGMLFPTGFLHVQEVKGNLNSTKYCQLLNIFALPLIRSEYDDDFVLQQDNAPPHISERTQLFLEQKGVTVMEWPAKSPDLNTIENCWHVLKTHVYESGAAKNISQLRTKILGAVQHFNASLDVGRRIYQSFGKRVLECHKRNGELLDV